MYPCIILDELTPEPTLQVHEMKVGEDNPQARDEGKTNIY